jgi:hypothetical protein
MKLSMARSQTSSIYTLSDAWHMLHGLTKYGRSLLPRRQPIRPFFLGTQNPRTSIGCGIFGVAISNWYVTLHSMKSFSPRSMPSPRSSHISLCRWFYKWIRVINTKVWVRQTQSSHLSSRRIIQLSINS